MTVSFQHRNAQSVHDAESRRIRLARNRAVAAIDDGSLDAITDAISDVNTPPELLVHLLNLYEEVKDDLYWEATFETLELSLA